MLVPKRRWSPWLHVPRSTRISIIKHSVVAQLLFMRSSYNIQWVFYTDIGCLHLHGTFFMSSSTIGRHCWKCLVGSCQSTVSGWHSLLLSNGGGQLVWIRIIGEKSIIVVRWAICVLATFLAFEFALPRCNISVSWSWIGSIVNCLDGLIEVRSSDGTRIYHPWLIRFHITKSHSVSIQLLASRILSLQLFIADYFGSHSWY